MRIYIKKVLEIIIKFKDKHEDFEKNIFQYYYICFVNCCFSYLSDCIELITQSLTGKYE